MAHRLGRKRRLQAILVLLLSTAATAYADAPGVQQGFFDQHAQGWFWYHDPSQVQPVEAPDDVTDVAPPPSVVPVSPSADDPVALIDVQRKTLERSLDQAILQPTAENVRAYLQLNQQLMNQSRNFAEAWRSAIWSTPTLDYTLTHPVGSAAYVKADATAANTEGQLRAISQDWGMIFFFRQSCPYCHKFAPVLKQFAAIFGFSIIPVSLDGGGLPEFPDPQRNVAAGNALQVEAVPAVYMVNPRTRAIVPAVFGLVGWSELAQRIVHAVMGNDGQEAFSESPSLQQLSLGNRP